MLHLKIEEALIRKNETLYFKMNVLFKKYLKQEKKLLSLSKKEGARLAVSPRIVVSCSARKCYSGNNKKLYPRRKIWD